MLNYNSPIVQAMLQNTPPGQLGNLNAGGGYFGSPPSIETGFMQMNPMQMQQPMQPMQQAYYPQQNMVGMSQAYQPQYMQQQYQPIGGYPYNSPYMAAGGDPYAVNSFYGEYQNPYFTPGLQSYGGIPQKYMDIPEVRATYMQAQINGLSYSDQLTVEVGVNKIISRAVNTALGRSEEEIEERLKVYDPRNVEAQEMINNQKPYTNLCMEVSVVRGDTVLTSSVGKKIPINDYNHGIEAVRRIDANCLAYYNNVEIPRAYAIAARMEAAKRAIPDNVGIIEYFNNYAGTWSANIDEQYNRRRCINGAGQLYNRDQFQKILREFGKPPIMVNGVKQEQETKNYFTSYGGHPYIPNDYGGDPEILTTLTINSKGQLEPVMPAFMRNQIKNQMDTARERFKAVSERDVARQNAEIARRGVGKSG